MVVCGEQNSFAVEFSVVSAIFADLTGRIAKLDQLHEKELASTRNEINARVRELVEGKKPVDRSRLSSSLLPHAPPSPRETRSARDSRSPREEQESTQPSVGHELSLNSSVVSIARPGERGGKKSYEDESGLLGDDTVALITDIDSEFVVERVFSASSRGIGQTPMHKKQFTLRDKWLQVEEDVLSACMERFEIKVTGLTTRRSCSLTDFSALLSAPESTQTDSSRSMLPDCSTIMHPYGFARTVWAIVSLFLIAYDFLMVPFQAFDVGDGPTFSVLDWLTALLWSLDILLWFRTGYYNHTVLEMDPGRIAAHYLTTWFAIDFTIVASQWVSRIASLFLSGDSTSLTRILGFIKLVRVMKLRNIWLVLKEKIVSNVVHYCSTVIILMLIQLAAIHAISCVWYSIGNGTDGWPLYDEYDGTKDTLFWYVASARWVIAQLNGRTDIDERRNLEERFFTCLVGMFLAILAHAVWVSVITRTMLELRELMSEKTRRRRLANEYLQIHPVSADLSSSVKRYLNDYQDANKALEMEKSVVTNLPKHVQVELLFEVRSPILSAHTLFRSLRVESMGCVRNLCHKGIKQVAAVQFEVIFDNGDTCSRMLFMDKVVSRYGTGARTRGTAYLQHSSGNNTAAVAWQSQSPSNDEGVRSWGVSAMANKLFSTRQPRETYYTTPGSELTGGNLIKEGSWVSEAALWTEWINRGRLISAEHGLIYAIEADEFGKTLQSYQEAFALTSLYAKAMVEELRKLRHVPTDILNFTVELHELTPIVLSVRVVSAAGLVSADGSLTRKPNPYCICRVSGAHPKKAFSTTTISDCSEPGWDFEGFVSVSERQSLQFEVWDSDFARDQMLGEVILEPSNFLPDGFDGELILDGGVGKGTLTVKVMVAGQDEPRTSESSANFPVRGRRNSRILNRKSPRRNSWKATLSSAWK